jgi:hypothetical protein
MPYYVFLNFEDADPNPQNKVKGSKSGKPAGIGSSAEGTLKVYRNRADDKSSMFNNKHAVYYPCQELIAREIAGTLTHTEVANISKDCKEAKTIAVVIHGTPDDTDQGFSSGGGQVCKWDDLGRLALMLFPTKAGTYNIALIMCYGARSSNASLDHRGQIPANDLKTSFAYKFFKSICGARNVRMSARTGAVSNDAQMGHTVETEEQVFSVIDKMSAKADRKVNKPAMDLQKQQFLAKNSLSPQQFDQMMFKFVQNPKLAPADDIEQFAKDYIPYSGYVNQYIDAMYGSDKLGNRDKYGKFIYTYSGGTLQIVSRYDSGNGPNYVLYSGPLL